MGARPSIGREQGPADDPQHASGQPGYRHRGSTARRMMELTIASCLTDLKPSLFLDFGGFKGSAQHNVHVQTQSRRDCTRLPAALSSRQALAGGMPIGARDATPTTPKRRKPVCPKRIHTSNETVRLYDFRAANVPRLLITAVITKPRTSRTNQPPSADLSDKKLIPFCGVGCSDMATPQAEIANVIRIRSVESAVATLDPERKTSS